MKVKNIDFERNLVIIRGGKGKKDRQTPPMQNIKGIFNTYTEQYKLTEYLIKGATGGRYSERSLERFVKNATQTAKITEQVSPHVLRYSFATQLLENTFNIVIYIKFCFTASNNELYKEIYMYLQLRLYNR